MLLFGWCLIRSNPPDVVILTFLELLCHPVEDSEGTFWLWLVCLTCWPAQTEVSHTGLSHKPQDVRCLLVWTRMFISSLICLSAGISVSNRHGCMKYCTQASLSHPIIKTWRLPCWYMIRRSSGLLELFCIEHGFCLWGNVDFLSSVSSAAKSWLVWAVLKCKWRKEFTLYLKHEWST